MFRLALHIFQIILMPHYTDYLFSFYKLVKKLKTWLPNTITQLRLNGLGLMYVHNDKFKNRKSMVIKYKIK